MIAKVLPEGIHRIKMVGDSDVGDSVMLVTAL